MLKMKLKIFDYQEKSFNNTGIYKRITNLIIDNYFPEQYNKLYIFKR